MLNNKYIGINAQNLKRKKLRCGPARTLSLKELLLELKSIVCFLISNVPICGSTLSNAFSIYFEVIYYLPNKNLGYFHIVPTNTINLTLGRGNMGRFLSVWHHILSSTHPRRMQSSRAAKKNFRLRIDARLVFWLCGMTYFLIHPKEECKVQGLQKNSG